MIWWTRFIDPFDSIYDLMIASIIQPVDDIILRGMLNRERLEDLVDRIVRLYQIGSEASHY
jgi:hypothetical protein